MGVWEGPVIVFGSLLGFIFFSYFANWLFVNILKVNESKVVTVLIAIFVVGFIAFLIVNDDGGRRHFESEPGVDYWMRR